MYSNRGIQDFVSEVCEQIRWTKAHPVVSKELKNHIGDQREENIKNGMNEADATKEAVKEMGNPIDIGMELDQIHRPRTQWKLISFVIFLALSGVFIRKIFLNSDYPLVAEDLFWTMIGIVFMLGAYFFNFSILIKHVKFSYIGLCILTLLFVRFKSRIVGTYVQAIPLTISYPLAFAFIVYSQRGKGYEGFFTSVFSMVPLLCLVVFIRSIASFFLLCISGFVILVYAIQQEWFGTPKKENFIILIGGTILAAVLILLLAMTIYPSYFMRLKEIYAPSEDNFNYAAAVTKEALSGAKFIGTGSTTGNLFQSIDSVPLTGTANFLVLLIHKSGWISFVGVILMMGALLITIFKLSQKYSSKLGNFIALSVVLIFGIQAAFYILFNLGFQVFSPLVFPLLSYGKLMQIVNLFLLGILLSTFRFSGIIEDILPQTKDNKWVEEEDEELTLRFKS